MHATQVRGGALTRGTGFNRIERLSLGATAQNSRFNGLRPPYPYNHPGKRRKSLREAYRADSSDSSPNQTSQENGTWLGHPADAANCPRIGTRYAASCWSAIAGSARFRDRAVAERPLTWTTYGGAVTTTPVTCNHYVLHVTKLRRSANPPKPLGDGASYVYDQQKNTQETPVPGPVPKRSSERIRRNKENDVEVISLAGPVNQPKLGIEDPHYIVERLWKSAAESGQAQYYEPSDWATLEFALHFADQLLKSKRPSPAMLQQVNTLFSNALLQEGERRRVRLEIERNKSAAEVVDIAEIFRQRLEGRQIG